MLGPTFAFALPDFRADPMLMGKGGNGYRQARKRNKHGHDGFGSNIIVF